LFFFLVSRDAQWSANNALRCASRLTQMLGSIVHMNRLAALFLAALAALGLSVGTKAADEVKLVRPLNLPINTKADEDDPFVSSNGLTLWYSSNADKKFDILMTKRSTLNSAWGKGETPDSYIQTEVDDRCACLTREEVYPQYLFYATKKDKDAKSFDLYVAVKQGRGKAFAEPTPIQIANTDADEMNPCLSADAKTLYFSRKTKDGWRVYFCTRTKVEGAQGFGEPELMKELPPNFHHITLAPDGITMYLQGPLEGGRTGLFVRTKTVKGWTKPQALTLLNHPEAPQGDRSPAVSRTDGGRWLYFASDRPGGKGGFDIWAIPTVQLRISR
jgi:hypothetical protein